MSKPLPFWANHLICAHQLWKEHLKSQGNAVDATCGRGSDLFALADLLLFPPYTSKIFVYDIQKRALEIAKMRAKMWLSPHQMDRIIWLERCHSMLGKAEVDLAICLIVYNLGYLPGGNRELTSCAATTIESLKQATQILQPRGAISIMCYPGHFEGGKETSQVLEFAEQLSSENWRVSEYRHYDKPLAPCLIWLKKGRDQIAQ